MTKNINTIKKKLSLHHFVFLMSLVLFCCFNSHASANENEQSYSKIPNVPYPSENPFSENKRILGKILFWDEQLSTDNSTACGTCHTPSVNGADKRQAKSPGYDKKLNTKDDTIGSPGVVLRNNKGQTIHRSELNKQSQVTGRTAQPYFLGLWANSNFWDGRARSEFIDPQTGEISIAHGGALENQALGPLMSSVEMAKQGQTAQEVTLKLNQSRPLALATNLTPDIMNELSKAKTYPDLFKEAFGDSSITLKRIAFAIATYERTLIADQTPWDVMIQNGKPLPYIENLGWEFFKQNECISCHLPPLFTDNKFYNVGIQGQNADAGHKLISSNDDDIGSMKVPSLRGTGLKTNFMHTGNFSSLEDVIDAYAEVPYKNIASKLPNGDDYNFQFSEMQRKALIAFLKHSLTDPRVQAETFPFDRPNLRLESRNSLIVDIKSTSIKLTPTNQPEISWELEQSGNNRLITQDIEIIRNDGMHYWVTTSPFIDSNVTNGTMYAYQLYQRNSNMINQNNSILLQIKTNSTTNYLWYLIILFITAFVVLLRRHSK